MKIICGKIFKKAFIWGIVGICLQIIAPHQGMADDLSLNVDLLFSGSSRKSNKKTTTSSTISQNYSLGFNKSFTETIRMSGDLRASQSKTESGADTTKSTSIRPSVFLTMNNAYFGLSGGYQSNFLPFASLGEDVLTSTWNTNFMTAPKGFPSLRISYDLSTSKDDFEVHVTDSKQSSVNTTTSYKIMDANLTYNFLKSKNEDFAGQTKQESPRHIGTLNYNSSFFNKKINYGLNFGASSSSSKSTSLSGEATIFDEKKEAINGLFEVDATPGDNALSDSSSLIDGSTASVATSSSGDDINLSGSDRNIGIKLKQKESISKIFIYVSTSESKINPTDFGFDVYFSNSAIGDLWTLISSSVTVSFNSTNDRFEFELSTPTEAVFFKVVNRSFNALADTINITEIEAIGSISSTPSVTVKSGVDRQFGGININWIATDKLNSTYSFNFDRSEQSPSGVENQNISQGITLFYKFSKKLSIFAGYQNQKTKTTSSPDVATNNYSLTFSTNPIETINGSIALSRNESLQNGDITSKTNSANLNTFYKLYPGIDLGTGFSLNLSESSGTDTKTIASNWNLNLLPWKTVNILIDGSVSGLTSKSEGTETKTTSKNLRSVINFTPSRHLNFTANLDFLPALKRNFSVNTRLPGDLQLNLNYNRTDVGTETVGSSVAWNASRNLFVNLSYNKTFLRNETGDTSSAYSLSVSIRK